MDSRHCYVQVGRCSHLQRARGDQAPLTPPGPPAPTRERPPSGTARGLGQGMRGMTTPASHEPTGMRHLGCLETCHAQVPRQPPIPPPDGRTPDRCRWYGWVPRAGVTHHSRGPMEGVDPTPLGPQRGRMGTPYRTHGPSSRTGGTEIPTVGLAEVHVGGLGPNHGRMPSGAGRGGTVPGLSPPAHGPTRSGSSGHSSLGCPYTPAGRVLSARPPARG